MDRNTALRWLLYLGLGSLFYFVILPKMSGKHSDTSAVPAETYVNAPDFVGDTFDAPVNGQANEPKEGELCTIKGNRFEAVLSSRGAAVTHFRLLDAQYRGTKGEDVSTTPDHERWRSLRTLFRGEGANDQLKYDRFNWKLAKAPNDRGCIFTYQDDEVAITKTVTADDRPFELAVSTQVTNLASAPRHHRFSISTYAFRKNSEIKGKLGRVSPFLTDLQCARDSDVTRKSKDDFKEGWFREPLDDRYAAVSNYYFAQALVPSVAYDKAPGGPGDATARPPAGTTVDESKPECALLAEPVLAPGQDADADESGAIYHAELAYQNVELAPKQSVTYAQIAYFGPKERDVLKDSAGGAPRLGDLINLGTFSPVAKFLVGCLRFFHDHVTFGSWGLAIIALTLCLRIGLFPLSWQQIHTSIAMRKIKPELDEVNKRFGDDMQARQMATMELYRKHGVNPMKGCLPQLVQLPIWWAMYTTLQTAVEMYSEKFLWIQDLSAPDKFFILPLVYGVFIVVQQRLVPQQGMDPMQQKMMTYMFPVLFTVLVLFLPAALGVYMLTSSALGIAQTLVVEKIAPRNPQKKSEIVVKQVDDSGGKVPALKKG
jgi:YidC/Oxa1 family membrane protein insertase